MERLKVGFLGIIAGCLLVQVGSPLIAPAHAEAGAVRCQVFNTTDNLGGLGKGKMMENMAAVAQPLGDFIGQAEPVLHTKLSNGVFVADVLCVR